ncbi:hypothetical protein AURDEDRAFT_111072 [Auricularia subglabra TFB-10046 SS5]|nr:hypothetical protein AURDEDRAFT_111072 [Auricularia subglabra TFB-10046 SS5]
MHRGGRGNRGGPAPQNFNGHPRGFAPRGGRGGRGRGRGGRGRGGGGGGGDSDEYGGMPALRRQDLADEIMSQVEDLEEEEEFNFGISFKTLGGGGPSRDSSSRGRGRGRGRGGSQYNGKSSNTRTYAYQDDTLIGAGRGATTRQRGSGLGFGSPTGKIVVAGGSGVRATVGSKDPWSLPDYGRPLLRPVVFVRATLQKTLFEEVDEVIQAHDIVLEDPESDNTANGAQNSHPQHHTHDPALSHAPTADRVAAVFGIAESEPITTTTDEEADESNVPATPKATQTLGPADSDDIEVQLEAKLRISDILSLAADEQLSSPGDVVQATTAERMDIAAIIAPPPAAPEHAVNVEPTPSSTPEAPSVTVAEEPVFMIDTTPSTTVEETAPIYDSVHVAPLGQPAPSAANASTPAEISEVSFVIDTTPSIAQTQDRVLTHSTSHLAPLGHAPAQPAPQLEDDDEEIIVYDPLDRSKPATPAPPATPSPASIENVSFARLNTRPAQPATPESTGRAGLGRLQQLKERVTARRAGKKRRQSFGMLGALLEETRVQAEARERAKHEEAYGKGKGKGEARDHPVYGRGREGDSDLEWGTASEDDDAGAQGDVSAVVHPDDSLASMDVDPELVDSPAFVRFAAGLREPVHQTLDDFEDAEKLAREDEDDEERSSEEEEDVEVPVSGEESDEVSEDDTEDESFDARLKKIRAREKKAAAAEAEESDEDEGEDEDTKADGDERYLANIHRMLEAEARGKGKGKKHQTFDAVLNGSFDYEEEENYFPERIKRKDKGKTFVDPALAAQWERDRQKKAQQKREREEQRALIAAAALSPQHAKHLAKRFMKDNRNSGYATGAPIALPDGKADFVVLEAEVRAFVGDLRRDALVLPPLDKASRARVHLIAQNFGLKSKSTGGGVSRFVTLSRTSRTRETAQNENKVRRLLYGGALKGGAPRAPRHRDGDEVGKAAPKLTDTNLGYRLLQQMGWAEGDRIGLSTRGLEAPISAFIKTTKLGLGATR